jgi:hypothetical protein
VDVASFRGPTRQVVAAYRYRGAARHERESLEVLYTNSLLTELSRNYFVPMGTLESKSEGEPLHA